MSIHGDRAGPGTDLGDVDGRGLEHVAAGLDEAARGAHALAELVLGGEGRLTGFDQRGLGGRAAHVEGDQVRLAERGAQARRADDAGRRARADDEDGTLGRLARSDHAAVGGHHQHGARTPLRARPAVRSAR